MKTIIRELAISALIGAVLGATGAVLKHELWDEQVALWRVDLLLDHALLADEDEEDE